MAFMTTGIDATTGRRSQSMSAAGPFPRANSAMRSMEDA